MSERALVGSSVLVERERELRTLGDLLDDAAVSTGSIAMLVGEAGIGKTRTATEFRTAALAAGAEVISGRCFDGPAHPYAPWGEALTQYVRRRDPFQLAKELGSDAAVLTHVFPALRQALPALPAPPALNAEDERLRLFDAVTRLLVERETPLVVVLDDLHAADRASLQLLEYVARDIAGAPMLLLGTHRDVGIELTDPLVQCLAELNRKRSYFVLHLERLSAAAVERLVRSLTDAPFSAELLAAVADETRGNPFFVEELVRDLVASAPPDRSLHVYSASWTIPATVREAVGARIERLTAETNRALSVAAAFPAAFDFRTLEAATELSEDVLLRSIDEALAVPILRSAGHERYEFCHPIVRHALYDEFSPSRRARLHRRIVQALERLREGGGQVSAADLAFHYHRSATLPGAEHGIGDAREAAEIATRCYAFEDAVVYWRMARDLAAGSGPAMRADVLCGLARAEIRAVLIDDGIRTIEAAREELRIAGAADDDVADFLRTAAWELQDAGAPRQTVAAVADDGLQLTAGRTGLTWARLKLAEYPIELVRADPWRLGRWLGFDPIAVSVARRDGDEQDYARTVQVTEWRTEAETRALYEQAQTWSSPAAAIHGLSVVARTLIIRHGAFEEAEEVCGRLLEVSKRARSVVGSADGHLYLAHAQTARGEFAAARSNLAEARGLVEKLGPGHRLHAGIRFLDFILADYGDSDIGSLAEVHLADGTSASTPPWMTPIHLAMAAVSFAHGNNRAEAERLIDALVPALTRFEPTTINTNTATAYAAAAAWELRRPKHAETLRGIGLALIEASVGDYTATSNELTVARTSALLGETATAREYFTRARAALVRDARRPLCAIVDYDEGRMLERSDPRSAGALLRSAAVEFETLGMTSWLARAQSAIASLPTSSTSQLTRREAEVLGLLAGGRTNREIASELVLSVHTVERHVATVYRKIDVRNRAEATAFALAHGLGASA